MKSFSTKRYINVCFLYIFLFFLSILLGLFFACLKEPVNFLLGVSLGGLLGCIIFVPPFVFYLICLVFYRNQSKKNSPRIGTISNWDTGFFRYLGNVSITLENKTYSTPSYMGKNEAQNLVGKNVSFCIINDTLFIYEILN